MPKKISWAFVLSAHTRGRGQIWLLSLGPPVLTGQEALWKILIIWVYESCFFCCFFLASNEPDSFTHTDAKHNRTVAGVKAKWAQIDEYWQKPLQDTTQCVIKKKKIINKVPHLARLRCLENTLHSRQHPKVQQAAIDLKRRALKVEGWALRVHHCAELQSLRVITTCPQAAHFLLSPTVSSFEETEQPCNHQPSRIWGAEKWNGGAQCPWKRATSGCSSATCIATRLMGAVEERQRINHWWVKYG